MHIFLPNYQVCRFNMFIEGLSSHNEGMNLITYFSLLYIEMITKVISFSPKPNIINILHLYVS